MKSKLKFIITAIALLVFPKINFGQAPTLGTAANWAIFSTAGAITNTGTGFLTKITGNVGTVAGGITGFGNVDGVMTFTGHADNAACASDILLAYNFLNVAPSTNSPGVLLGNGQILNAGVHNIPAAATMNLDLILDGQGDPNAVFIFQIQGPFATGTNSKVKLINGTKACNVFWKVEGAVSMATGTTMRGTIIANNAAITMNVGDTLEGRAFAINGAILCSELLAYTPIGCGSPSLTGPVAPTFGASNCFAVFSSIGALGNTPTSNITGDVGNAGGAFSGWSAGEVTGTLHPTGDGATMAAATDLGNVNSYLLALPFDIELLFPPQFGHNLVLTPHTYLLNAATALTDTVYLNGMGDPNAVFVIQIYGAFTANANSRVILTNGTQTKNVFWKINGAVDLGVGSIFYGTMIVDGAFLLQPGVEIIGRALTINGAITTTAVTVSLPPGVCGALLPPVIVTDPTDQTVCTGNSVSFTVSATGDGLTYQWRKGIVNLVDGGNISGATTATLTINPATIADAALDYNVVVSGSSGPSVTSTNASLIINTPPTITTEPTDQMVCPGGSANFSVVASGAGITYQWKKGMADMIDGGNISGATSSMLTINPVGVSDTASNYYVVISGACPPNDTSINVSLSNSSAVITLEPINQQISCGGSSVSFSVLASGTGITYQWRKGLINLINGGNISGVNTPTLTINPAGFPDAASNYNVVVTGACAPSDTSIDASLVMTNAPIITSQPTDQTVCVGSSVSFSVASSGAGLSYQWTNGTVDLIDGGNISGATSSVLTINPVSITDSSSNYYVVVSGACAPNDTSLLVSLIINAPPIITVEPINQVACPGSSVSFSVVATGVGITYQWRKGTSDMIDGGNISGAQTATLTINPMNATDSSSNYYVVVTGTCLPNDTSINVSLLFNSPLITSEPLDQTTCLGSSVSFSVTSSGSGLTYQWRNGTINMVDGGAISGSQTATLTINPVSMSDTSSFYNVVVTGGCAPNDTSINVSLQLNSTIITSEPISQTACVGNSVSFSVTASGSALTYQWRNGTVNMIDGGTISGATTATLTINPASISDTSSFYNVVITGGCAPNDTSINVSLILNTFPNITTQPVPAIQSVCEGGSASFTVAATGAGITYQWRKGNVLLIDGGNISGATTATLTINPAGISDSSSFYNVVILGTCALNDTSINVTLMVKPIPVASPTSTSLICTGSTINLDAATVIGATYAWTSTTGFSSSSQNPVLNSATTLDGGIYTLIVTLNGCPSLPATVGVAVNDCNSDLSIVKTVSDSTPSIGGTVVFTITVQDNGPLNATGVEVTDILQSGYAYVSSTVTTGAFNPSTGVWTIGVMNNGDVEVLTITATVLAEGNYVNTAIVYGTQTETNMSNNNSTVETFPIDFNIPEGFSPNGDGINDLFVIRGIKRFPKNEFTIFNRWGNKVFAASPYKNTWDGKAEMGLRVGGDELPVGTYFYLLDLKDGTPIYKGTIYLNR